MPNMSYNTLISGPREYTSLEFLQCAVFFLQVPIATEGPVLCEAHMEEDGRAMTWVKKLEIIAI